MNQTSKPRYRTSNWKQYNAALKARGSLSIWLDKRMSWFAAGRGKPHHSLGQQMVDETLVFKAALQLEQLGGDNEVRN